MRLTKCNLLIVIDNDIDVDIEMRTGHARN